MSPWVSSGSRWCPDVRQTHQTRTIPTAAAVNKPMIPGICKEMFHCSVRVKSMATFHFLSPQIQQLFKSLMGKMCINHSLACNGEQTLHFIFIIDRDAQQRLQICLKNCVKKRFSLQTPNMLRWCSTVFHAETGGD